MLKGSFVFIALCFVLIQFSSGVHGDPDPCAAFNASCAVCTAQSACGWCGPVATCMSGNKQGPTSQKCYGDSWFFGTTNLNGNNPCPDCNAITTCKGCLYFDADCMWCASSGKCKENGNWLGCTGVNTCPCDIYGSCSDCVKDPQCLWCGGSNQTCVGINDACVQPAHTCPCADNLDCRSCFDDSNQGCVWCQQEGVGTCTSTPDPTCGIAMNCNTYCSTNGPTCTTCNELNSCAWCESLAKCVDSTSPVCSFFQHTCPDCSSHRFCDTCQDAGCSWCRNGECRATGDLAGCDIIGTGQCDQYCAYFSDCNGCNVLPGCAWCEDSNSCVDSDSATCFIAHSCSDAKTSCGFDGGAFVGGMFLGIGLVAIGLGGFLFYRWKTGTKYTELK